MSADHKAAKEWAEGGVSNNPDYADENLAAAYLELRKLAKAVVDRWDTPLWKEVPATAEYINALRKVLEESK